MISACVLLFCICGFSWCVTFLPLFLGWLCGRQEDRQKDPAGPHSFSYVNKFSGAGRIFSDLSVAIEKKEVLTDSREGCGYHSGVKKKKRIFFPLGCFECEKKKEQTNLGFLNVYVREVVGTGEIT